MGQFILNYPDGVGTRIVNAIAATQGYQENISDGSGGLTPNPETKAEFAKRILKEWLKNMVVGYEASIAGQTANQAQEATSNTEIDITTT